MGIQTYNPWEFYWVWSNKGPFLNDVHHGAWFKDGLHPFPIAGPEAQRLATCGYELTRHQEGVVPGEWNEYAPGRFQLTFAPEQPAPAARRKKRRGNASG